MHLFFQTDLVLNAIYYYFFFFSQKLCPELSENLVKIKRAVYKEHKKGLDVSVEAQRVRRKTAAEPFVFSVKDMSALYKIPSQHHTHTRTYCTASELLSEKHIFTLLSKELVKSLHSVMRTHTHTQIY